MPKQFGNLVIMRLDDRPGESPELRPGFVFDLGAMPRARRGSRPTPMDARIDDQAPSCSDPLASSLTKARMPVRILSSGTDK